MFFSVKKKTKIDSIHENKYSTQHISNWLGFYRVFVYGCIASHLTSALFQGSVTNVWWRTSKSKGSDDGFGLKEGGRDRRL